MKGKTLNIVIFILSLFCLVVSIRLFWNMGVYVDEANTSPDIVLGGNLYLAMDWLRLFCSALLALLSGINIFRKNN